jgi:hypothetical protein
MSNFLTVACIWFMLTSPAAIAWGGFLGGPPELVLYGILAFFAAIALGNAIPREPQP